jgi:hypothetical protein
MNSQAAIHFHNQALQERLRADKVDFTWTNISHEIDADEPIFVAAIPIGDITVWVSYDEYRPTYIIDSVAGESFETEGMALSLDQLMNILAEFIPHLSSHDQSGSQPAT